MAVIPAELARRYTVGDATFTTLAGPSTGTAETSAWRVALAPGAIGAPHHLSREELFLATAGAARASLDGVEHVVRAGEVLVVPAGVTLVLATAGTAPFEAVAVLPVGAEAVLADGTSFVPPWAG